MHFQNIMPFIITDLSAFTFTFLLNNRFTSFHEHFSCISLFIQGFCLEDTRLDLATRKFSKFYDPILDT